ncbi:MAG: hypothetical protein WA993_02920 [Candidatus Binatus sp.]|jgi:hypothetical protein
MTKSSLGIISTLVAALLVSTTAWAQGTVVVAVPAKAGAVEGTTENSDAFIWRLFIEFAAPALKGHPSPVVFETWASDDDTFSPKPHWPAVGEPMKLHASVLELVKTLNTSASLLSLRAKTIDVGCKAPVGAAVGGFPTSGAPLPCIAEQVARNRPQFDYIVKNNLNTQAGLAAAYAKSFKVEMPPQSVAVKGDWIPLPTLLQWIPQLGDVATIKKLYYTATVSSVEYALVAMHVSSRQNPNWVWGTFEHQMNPGRCDAIGCFDSFGAQIPAVQPNRTAVNTQYGSCPKTHQLKTLMSNANLSPVWENYCLKSTEVEYTAADGTPYVLGNSVIEGIVGNGTVAASSCITCHAYASFGPTGKPSSRATAMLPFNPTGNPIPGVLAGSHQFAFMWGVLLAPP